ncbi:14050_t:CDS:10, partial [Entrophospora sp. SA101]
MRIKRVVKPAAQPIIIKQIFSTLLTEVGLSINQCEEEFHNIPVEPSVFRRQLTIKLKNQPKFPDPFIGQFLDSLQEYLDQDAKYLTLCLHPLSVNADSLIKVLLSIDFLQTKLIDHLLERLPTFISESDDETIESPLPRLILQQLKYLDHIVDPIRVQREIITSLPEIINDSEQKTFIKELVNLMDQNHQLLVPILDALSNFDNNSQMLRQIQESVIDKLECANLDDLPIIIQFLFDASTSDDVNKVIRKIRDKVDFRSIEKIQDELAVSKRNQKRKRDQTPEPLILESIKFCILSRKYIHDAWLKIINDISSPIDHKIIDILVLLILHSIKSSKKKVEAIFRKKISVGLFTQSLLKETIINHHAGLEYYFPGILSLSECLLRTSLQDATIVRAACAFYHSAFVAFDTIQQQEIICSLATHIGCGSFTEVDSALSVLLHLVETNVKEMVRFSIFIKSLLDSLDQLTLDQTRVLFEIFCKFIYEDSKNYEINGGLLAEFSIIIQKMLSNSNEKYTQIGVIGALALVRTLGSKQLTSNFKEDNGSQSHRGGTNYLLKVAEEHIIKIEQHCSRHMNCLSFAYDELAYFISKNLLDSKLEKLINEKMASSFQNIFIVDHEEVSDLQKINYHLKEIPIEIWMQLDDQACIKAEHEGSLFEIDALLGSGITMFQKIDPNEMKDFSQEIRETACNAIFYCINWFRELINAFCDQREAENYQKLNLRLKHINELEKLLNAMLEVTPSFQPFGFPSQSIQQSTQNRGKKQNKSIGTLIAGSSSSQRLVSNSGKTLRRSATNKAKVISVRAFNENESAKSSNVPLKPNFASVNDLKPLMRELEMPVFGLLEFGYIKQTTDIEITGDFARLEPSEMLYLLEDLNRKLEFKLYTETSTSPVPFFASKLKKNDGKKSQGFSSISRTSALEIVEIVIGFLPFLLKQMESFLNVINTNNGDTLFEEKELEDIYHCLGFIWQIIYRLISWNDLKSPDNVEILIKVLNQFSSKEQSQSLLCSTFTKQQLLHESIDDAFNYLYKFESNVPTANLAIKYHKILKKIVEFSPNLTELTAKCGELAHKFSSQEWEDKWKLNSESILYLVLQDIQYATIPIDRISYYTTKILPSLETCDEGLDKNPLLTKDTFPHFYKALSISLVDTLREYDDCKFDTNDEILLHLAKIVECWKELVNVIKSNHNRVILSVALKYGRNFIDLFLKKILPFMDSNFKSHRNDIVIIFKNFQSSSRSIQALCNHVKVTRDTLLAKFVPLVKKSLEIVIFQVKAMLQNNGCPPDAFFLGNLKHRDLEGQEVSDEMPCNGPQAQQDDE